MQYTQLATEQEHTLFDGFYAKFVHGEQMTMTFVRIEAGKWLPEHSHHNEQITTVLEGALELTIGGEIVVVRSGEAVVIPSNVVHSGKALTDCRVVDVFTPVREDFKQRFSS